MSDPAELLARIDDLLAGADLDCGVGPDAMRWVPEGQREKEIDLVRLPREQYLEWIREHMEYVLLHNTDPGGGPEWRRVVFDSSRQIILPLQLSAPEPGSAEGEEG